MAARRRRSAGGGPNRSPKRRSAVSCGRELAVDAPVPVAAWRDPKDPRHAITVDNLLRMNSGIEFGQSLYSNWYSAFDPSVQMEFDMADQAAFAETAELGATPG